MRQGGFWLGVVLGRGGGRRLRGRSGRYTDGFPYRGCGRPDSGGLSVLNPEGVERHFQFRRRVAGNFLYPGAVPGLVRESAFPLFPDAFGHGHAHVRTEAGRETQRVLQVVMTALGKVNAGQFGVRLLVVGYRRNYAGVEGPYRYHVLERSAHGMAGEAFHVADYHLSNAGAECLFEGLHFGRGAAAAGRGVGLMRHEHRIGSHLLFLQAVDVLHLG